jgi:hypothetical protein
MSKTFNFSNITDDLKKDFKALLEKFNVTPVVNAATPPAPSTTPAVTSPSPTTPSVVSYNVDGGQPVFVDISDDGISGIEVNDKVYSDVTLTTPYPDGNYSVTGTDFKFTVTGGSVSAVLDPDGTGAGAPIEAPNEDTTSEAPIMPGMSAQISQLREELEALKAKFSAEKKDEVSKETEALKSEVETLKNTIVESNKLTKDMFEIFGKAMDTPSAEPTEKPMSKADRMLKNLGKL